MKKWKTLSTSCAILAVLVLFGFAGDSHGTLSAVSTQLTPPQFATLDLPSPGTSTGFPRWYQDSLGQALDLCLSAALSPNVVPVAGTPPALMCLVDPPLLFPDNPLSWPTNFPDEAFWFAADASITLPQGGALYVAAIEAAFANEVAAVGDQISFARIRIRVDIPEPGGTYIVTHPYGVNVFNNVAPGIRAINFTSDVGVSPGIPGNPPTPPNFNGALFGAIGPFLNRTLDGVTPALIPVGAELFIGDPNIDQLVIGSPFGTNFFRIEGPNIGGPGVNVVQTNLFRIAGKVFTDPLPTPLVLDRAGYSRSATGIDVSVFASSAPTATVEVSGLGIPPSTFLASDGAGKFFGMIRDLAAVPSPTTVTASRPGDAPTSLTTTPVDLVDITKAEFNMTTDILTVEANSSDTGTGANAVTLTAVGFGPLTSTAGVGSLTVPVASGLPPASVTVTSSAGGVDTHPVTIIPDDVITITAASYQTRGSTWTVSGTGSEPGNTITVNLGISAIGSTIVDAAGAWRLAVRNSLVIPGPGAVVSAVSSQGGQATRAVIIR